MQNTNDIMKLGIRWDKEEIDKVGWTEQELQKFIYGCIPGISYKDMWEIRGKFVCDSVSIYDAIEGYINKKKENNNYGN